MGHYSKRDEAFRSEVKNDTESRVNKNFTDSNCRTSQMANDMEFSVEFKDKMHDEEEQRPRSRSNSVSKLAQQFEVLKGNAAAAEKVQQKGQSRGSRGIQRYRERKEHAQERFNTQPVTYQEVQEAVLQNQRMRGIHASKSETQLSSLNDPDEPSKLSLAERVSMFDQKLTKKHLSPKDRSCQERIRSRRPINRYKTQPITFEEVEVASRLSPIDGRQCYLPTEILGM